LLEQFLCRLIWTRELLDGFWFVLRRSLYPLQRASGPQ
jgi:hypothetical protein